MPNKQVKQKHNYWNTMNSSSQKSSRWNAIHWKAIIWNFRQITVLVLGITSKHVYTVMYIVMLDHSTMELIDKNNMILSVTSIEWKLKGELTQLERQIAEIKFSVNS